MDGVWARGTTGAHASRWQAPAGRPLHTEAAGLQDGPTAIYWDEQRSAAGPILAVAEQQLCEDLHRHLVRFRRDNHPPPPQLRPPHLLPGARPPEPRPCSRQCLRRSA